MRVNRVRRDRLARRVDHRDLHPRPEPGIEAHRRPCTGGGSQQQVAQIGGEHADGVLLGALPQPRPQIHAEADQEAGPPRPADRFGEPAVPRPALVGDAEMGRDQLFVIAEPEVAGRGSGTQRLRSQLGGIQLEVEELFLLSAQHRQDPVRWQPGQRLGILEVVRELRAGLLLAVPYPRYEPATRPHPLPEHADQVGILGETLREDRPRAVQGGRHVRHALRLVHIGTGGLLRVCAWVGEKLVGQRLEAGFAGYLRLRPALWLIGEVDVLEARLGISRHDLRFKRLVQLALGTDRLQDHRAPFRQLTQVPQPLLQRPQLRVVQCARRLLAVAGNERHGGPAVEQIDSRRHLTRTDAEFSGDRGGDGLVRCLGGRCHDFCPPFRWAR